MPLLGEDHLERIVDNSFAKADYLRRLIERTEGFRLVFDGRGCAPNVCFEYVPPRLREADASGESFRREMHAIPPQIKEAMIKKGSLMIGYQPLAFKGKANFFRLVIPAQPPPTEDDMAFVIEEIQRCGKDL